VDLQRGSFDPLAGLAPETVNGLEASGQLFIVQFHTQGIEAYREALRAEGAEVLHFMPHQAHVVRMDEATAARVGELPMVRWVGPYRASYRLEHEVLAGLVEGNLPTQRYYVQVLDRGPLMKGVVASRLRGLGALIETQYPDGYRLEATMTPEQVRQAAAWDEVFWIDRWSAPEEDMNKVRNDGGANAIETMAGFTGVGVRAEAMDGNLDFGHPDLQSNPVIAHGGNSGGATHGTPVTGIVFGDGAGLATRRGLLPDGQGIFASYNNVGNRYAHTAQLLAAPYFAVFQTNSWGTGLTSNYNSTSMEMDDILFDNDIVIFQSQSNTGNTSSRPQAWAKNIVSVGGIRHQDTLNTNDDAWAGAGSIGPASDGRIKPDLSYWYDSILAPQAGGGSTQFGGTSAATPMTAGYFGLMYEMWHAGIFGNTPAATVFDSRPKATTARALMINSAARYDFNGQNSDLTRTHQGWGRANVENLYSARDDMFIVNEEDVLTEFSSAVYPIAVDANTPELAVTLVYLDLPGTTSSSIHRINDLSLRVTSPGGVSVYWGNNGLRQDNTSSSGGSSNTKDPIENVFIDNPEAGTWTIQVFADEVNQDGHVETAAMDVDFSLVVRGTSGLGGTPCLEPVVICEGAPNSFSVTGTVVFTQGSVSVASNDLVFVMGGLPANEFGLWFYGTAPNNAPVGNGTICVGGSAYRLAPVQSDFLGTLNYALDLSSPPEPAAQVLPGDTWYFQFWYRDPAAGGANFNFSDALSITFCE
jgi:serine protease AprX